MDRRISVALGLPKRTSLRQYQLETQGRPCWPIDWRYICFVIVQIVWHGDSMQLRALFATASAGWAVLILRDNLIAGSQYTLLRLVPSWLWACLFIVHFFGGWWRLIERKARKKTAFLINLLGVVIWFSATSAINWASGHLVIGSTLEWCALFFLVCATINTGRGEERGTP